MKLAIITMVTLIIHSSLLLAAAQSDGGSPKETPLPPIEKRFPQTHDATAIMKLYSSPREADGEGVAVEGEVVKVVWFKDGLPGIVLQLSKQPEVNIFVIPTTKIDQGTFLKLGERLRAMGYLRKTGDMVKLVGIEASNENPLSLMSLCAVQPTSLAGVFDQKYIRLCAGWQKGLKLPRLSE